MPNSHPDICQHRGTRTYDNFHGHILERVLAGETLPAILEAIVLGVEQANPAMLCSLMLLDGRGSPLGKRIAPSLPASYKTAMDALAIGPGVASCGTAAFTGERVIVADITTHAFWKPYRELASNAGLGACWSQPIRAASGQVLGTFGIYHREARTPKVSDISIIEQSARLAGMAIERNLADADIRIAAITFDSLEAMMVTDARGVILRVNRAFTQTTGYTAEEAVGQTPRLLNSGRHPADFFRAMWEGIERTGGWQGEIWDRRKNGEVYPKWLTISAVNDGDGFVTNYIGTHYDITDRKKAEEKLNELAFFDPLTHLPNRTLLLDRLKQAMTAGNRNKAYGALLFIDLDHFKTLNDTQGHDQGDQLLRQVALRITASVREGDTVARLGAMNSWLFWPALM